jgi:hypothetical protein
VRAHHQLRFGQNVSTQSKMSSRLKNPLSIRYVALFSLKEEPSLHFIYLFIKFLIKPHNAK